MFGARLGPFHRTPAKFARGESAERHVRIIRNLDSEAAADINTLQMDLINPYPQSRRKKLCGKSRKGIIRPILDAIFFEVPFADHGVVLKRRAREAMKMHAADFHHVRGLLKRLI